MKTKHTKGPWEYEGSSNSSVDIVLPDLTTVTIDRCNRYTGEYDISRENMEANAQLISAAPELIEALINIKEILESPGLIDAGDLRRIADAAIKKAIG